VESASYFAVPATKDKVGDEIFNDPAKVLAGNKFKEMQIL